MSKKTTKRALAMSFVSVFLCVCMLVGTTFAWFTDTVTSSNNIIKSGTLDVEMSWADGKTDPANTTWKNAAEGAIFKNDLWEPGYTEVRHIKIENKGTLALKYQLNITANGNVSKLADVIDVYYADPAVKVADRTLGGLAERGTLTAALAGMSTTAYGELAAGASDTVTIALKMQEDATNEYQNLAIGSDFAVQLVATQLEAEVDSFDKTYDKGAAWDGVIPTALPETVVFDDAAKTVTLKDAAALAAMGLIRDKITTNHGGRVWEWTINLDTNVNLLNKEWKPVTLQGFKAFDGNGHIISNLYVNSSGAAGLFGTVTNNDSGSTVISNLTIDGAYVQGGKSVGALVGSNPQGILKNVTINNATVIGTKYVGGIFGSGNGDVNDSKITNSTVLIPEGGEKEAGGLAGYISNDGTSSTVNKVIANNTVENVTVTAPTIASGLVAQPNSSNIGGALIVIENNTMKNVTITTTADKTADLYVSNNVGGKSVVQNNNADANCKVVVTESVSTTTELKDAVANNNAVKVDLAAGAYDTNFKVAGGKDVTIEGNGKDTVLNGQIATTASNEGTLVLRNLTINVSSAINDSTGISQTSKSAIAIWGDQTVICENVTFNMDLANSTAITSWWDTGVGTTIIVRNCTFNCNGNRPIRATGNVTVENCTFNDPYRYAVQLTAKASTATLLDKATINFNNNTIVNGENGKAFVYGIQLEGADYGCNNCVINGAGNTIVNGGTDSAMYYCECGKVDHATITWNTEVPAVHENP